MGATDRESPVHAKIATTAIAVTALAACGPGIAEDDPEVVAWTQDAAGAMSTLRDDVAAEIVAGLPEGSHLVATQSTDGCARGQHNWKIDDPYDLRCGVWANVAIAVPTQDTFLSDMDAAEKPVLAAGFTSVLGGARDQLAGYVELFGMRDRPGADGGVIAYGAQHLPGVGYYGADDLRAGFAFTGPDDLFLRNRTDLAEDPWVTPAGEALAPNDLAELLEGNAYGLLVSLGRSAEW